MIDKASCIQLGRIRKASGYKGEVFLNVDIDLPEDLTVFGFFHLEIDGDLIPFFIEEIDFMGSSGLRVKFIDVPSQEKAKLLIDCPVFIEQALHPGLGENSSLTGIEGFTVIDKNKGEIGEVTGVIQNPKQDLLVVQGLNSEVLIPVVDEIVLNVDPEKRQIIVDLPEGLTSLNS